MRRKFLPSLWTIPSQVTLLLIPRIDNLSKVQVKVYEATEGLSGMTSSTGRDVYTS
jgi:hypothetical protein